MIKKSCRIWYRWIQIQDLGLWSMSALDYDLSYFWLNWSLINFCSPKAIAHRVWNFRMRFSVFSYSHPFLSKYMQRMRKRRKSNLIRIFFDGRKYRRQCANVIDTTWGRIYFLTCENFGQNFGLSVQRPWDFGLISKTCNKPGASLREDAWRDWIADNPCVFYGTVD